LWLSRGKNNRDISEILGLKPHTVNKHLEQIIDKLRVETRTVAAAAALIRRLKARRFCAIRFSPWCIAHQRENLTCLN